MLKCFTKFVFISTSKLHCLCSIQEEIELRNRLGIICLAYFSYFLYIAFTENNFLIFIVRADAFVLGLKSLTWRTSIHPEVDNDAGSFFNHIMALGKTSDLVNLVVDWFDIS
jgi:hypothetical protein